MLHTAPELVTTQLLDELKAHHSFRSRAPAARDRTHRGAAAAHGLPQAACFDTAFHRSMPRLPRYCRFPRRYAARGMQRYGFHGLSYTFLMQELARLGDPAAARGPRHSGAFGQRREPRGGARRQCIDTSMGFTPTAGLVMGTRSGDLDPGLMSYLVDRAMTARNFKPWSIMSRDCSGCPRAAPMSAICSIGKRAIRARRGAGAVLLPGEEMDRLVRRRARRPGHAGICRRHRRERGAVRERICDGLEFLGISIDDDAQSEKCRRHFSRRRPVAVRVIRTDEESVIAGLSIRCSV
jgi:acetate kinase